LRQIGPFGTGQVFLMTESTFQLENLAMRESRPGSFLPSARYDHSEPASCRRRCHSHLVMMMMMHLLLVMVKVMVK
jgi:hypothetical protein